jgi:hypothetical protein
MGEATAQLACLVAGTPSLRPRSRQQLRARHCLVAGPLECVPEPAAQCVPYLVMQQRIDRQCRPLQQSRLEIRRHARLPCQHSLEPQRRGISRHGLAESEALRVRGLNSFAHRQLLRRGALRWRSVGGGYVRLLASRAAKLAGRRRLTRIRCAAILAIRQAVAGRELALRQRSPLGVKGDEAVLLPGKCARTVLACAWPWRRLRERLY